jgi:guanosine-3',5'-bis(diphosphate) 3'-pyrophosphohydrolase
VHRADCPNARDLMREPERIIEVAWEDSPSVTASYKVEVHVEAVDRMNLLRDVTAALSEEGVNVVSATTETDRDGMVTMRFLFQVSDVSHVDDVLHKLYDVEGVFEARRMRPGEYTGTKKQRRE